MDSTERTKTLLIRHYQTYPKLQIQDLFKFLYQSAFGCEHLVSSLDAAADNILQEYHTTQPDDEPNIVPLDGPYSRVPLSYLIQGLRAETLAHLFVASAKQEESGPERLLAAIGAATELVQQGLLPFSASQWDFERNRWQAAGYPPLHHSNRFRECYRPSYRVIANRYIPFLPLFSAIDKQLDRKPLLVALEGGSASGKTTLSQLLADIYPCTVFHMDDFFLRPEQRTPERLAELGGNTDWERFLTEVLQPARGGNPVRYRAFDCHTMSLSEEITLTPQPLVIVEGAYSMHPHLAPYFDISAFLDIPPDLQRTRILHRNSPQMAQRFFNEWIPLEAAYFAGTHIQERCNLIIQIPQE